MTTHIDLHFTRDSSTVPWYTAYVDDVAYTFSVHPDFRLTGYIVPRCTDDTIVIDWTDHRAHPDEMKKYLTKIANGEVTL